jgi:carboxyl-terminal processing protease
VGISASTINNDKLYEISKNIEIFINIYKELNANYVDDLDPNQLMKVGIDAMVGSLDPYTNYISESQVASYRINTEGKYEGIGAIVQKIDDYVTIVEPYQNSPVLEAGLKAGDRIIEIEGNSTKGKSREEVTAFYRGVPGTMVRLKILTPKGEEKIVDLKRSEVVIPNVPYSGFVDDNIGYVSLTTFTSDASKNIKKAYRDLKNENPNLKGFILDLRNNGGGLLREAVLISNLFIPQDKEVVSVKSKVRERDQSYKTTAPPLDTEIPLVVLINKNSASASEIVSGVIQDYDRGVLMGQRSYGKGLVQNTKEVGYNSRIKLTTSKYYIPSGRCIQSVEYDNGEPVDIPDDKRSKFKTAGGRTVLDGGGVTPDVKLKLKKNPEVLEALNSEHLIFKFANEYIESMDTSKRKEEVVFEDFALFQEFVKKSDFKFESKSQKLLSEIKADFLDKETMITSEIDKLDMEIEALHKNAIEENKSEITEAIELELATRLNFQEGKVYQKLKNDEEIKSAIALLYNAEEYKALLISK